MIFLLIQATKVNRSRTSRANITKKKTPQTSWIGQKSISKNSPKNNSTLEIQLDITEIHDIQDIQDITTYFAF